MGRAMTKAERLREMERLYYTRAYSDAEMAQRLGVDRTTVYRDRLELEEKVPFVQESHGKWRIDRQRYLSNIRVNIQEALILYIASRREIRRVRGGYRSMASALEKLAFALRSPMTERLVKSAEAVLAVKADVRREKVFDVVARAWSDRLRLRLRYQGLETRKPYRDRVSPYLIEPSPWSDSVYLIGYSDVFAGIATYRLDRILEAHLTSEGFDLPEDFDEEKLLQFAWGIWRSEEAPETVVLKFKPGTAAKRLLESVWHPLEKVERLEDGSCIWKAPIAEPREMLPWIRGWGADVEVLAPEELRAELRREARRLSELYLPNEVRERPARYLLWAKARQESGDIHPLIYHMIDVGEVAMALWKEVIPESERRRISDVLGLPQKECGKFLAFLAATHDLGKASPGFQDKFHEYARRELAPFGFDFPAGTAPHGTVSTVALRTLLKEELGMDRWDAVLLAHVVGGHHGAWPSSADILNLYSDDLGGSLWEEVRRLLFLDLLRAFDPPKGVTLPGDAPLRNGLLIWISGLVTAADWIGSMDDFFPYEDRFFPPEEYAAIAKKRADQALEGIGWTWQGTSGEVMSFEDMFPFPPNAIQSEVMSLTKDLPHPSMVLIEAPTGIGKTEMAFYLADTWLQAYGGRGIYVAMPTQATSNQMFDRTRDFLLKRYPHKLLNLHLAHGNAAWTDQMASLKVLPVGETLDEGVAAMQWFLPRKRTLLAPFGVGTVDQALMSVLQARHFFLRMFGLANKVVVFDEVHAYDTYMSRLFQRLLGWLHTIGASVVILSATLPKKTRERLVSAYLGEESSVDLPDVGYPRLTVVGPQGIRVHQLPSLEDRTIRLSWIPSNPQEIADLLRSKLKDGGCAAVVCNTVAEAQDVYETLREAGLVEKENLMLFHAQMPFAWRKEVESRVLDAFGKNGHRPHKAIVVATQVIEQSLDLDFDLMVSALAPIDLLIQRAGRLHRHERESRPRGLETPQLFILRPDGDLGSPNFGRSVYVYEKYVLWQTWRALDGKDALTLPAETDSLIEAVYGDEDFDSLPEPLSKRLQEAHSKMEKTVVKSLQEAENRLIPEPSYEDLVTEFTEALNDADDPRIHEKVRALTRLIQPGVSLVCLHRVGERLNVEPDGTGVWVNLNQQPSRPVLKALLQHTVSVRRHEVVDYFIQRDIPDAWKDIPALRYHYPVIFEEGKAVLEGSSCVLYLTKELGLRIEKEDV